MKLLTTPSQIRSEMCSLIKRYSHYQIASAWASANSTPFDLLKKYESNISKMIIGTHFYQTHPDFIKEFRKNKNTKFALNTAGVFHPKIFLFYNSAFDWTCLVGSANFTKSAFTLNKEIMVLCSSEDIGANKFFEDFQHQILDYWSTAKKINKDDYQAYKKVWTTKQKQLKNLKEEYGSTKAKRPLFLSEVFSINWQEYVKAVKKDNFHSFNNRLKLLKKSHQIFSRCNNFNELNKIERRKIAGLDFKENSDGYTWVWFGSMKGAGKFQNKINENNEYISLALNAIPLTGTITKSDYMDYIFLLKKAFPEGGVKVSVASRLLAMKRPDHFICLSSRNQMKICEDFGIPKNINFEKYWDEIVLRIQDSVWWNTPAPIDEIEKQLWDGRVAMIDVLYYEE